MILAIDVGGTKTLVALYQQQGDNWQLVKQEKYQSAAYQSMPAILSHFMAGEPYSGIAAICLGVAGPVVEGVCQITNLSWGLSVAELQEFTQVPAVYLLNDLEATAWGIRFASEEQFLDINPNATAKQGNIAILSAGTGLGEAMLIREGEHVIAVATEGGHTDFAPQNAEQDQLLVFLREKYQGHVSYERLVSGQGLCNIYQYLKALGEIAVDDALEIQLAEVESDSAAVIGMAGLAETDSLCKEAVRVFCQIYAAEAANLALKCLPYGGVVLAGGITPKLLAAIQRPFFMQAFLNKGRYKGLLQNIPVRACLDEQIVLSGALAYAQYVTGNG
ncbi:MAG: glucokinase [Methyloprofundus sp.]|nr:glucokinase [Methyloprofundus sp.]